jgi:predicted CXXCH cytochrome family protein
VTITTRSFALAVALAVAPPVARAAPQEPPPGASKASPLAPLPPATPNLVVHAPYGADACTPCHARDDARDPGKVAASMNEVCLACHAELEPVMAAKYRHPAAEDACTNCHNPHNAATRKLLRADGRALCAECHPDTVDAAGAARVPHRALTTGASCTGCHNPHASTREKLLVRQPLELCLSCHDREGLRSADGKPLTDMKSWLARNAEHHGPIQGGDCTSCHRPHGGDHFRLLTEAYPATFYAGFDRKNYTLCLSCHVEEVFTVSETTALTSFRDGSRNLHFTHVNVGDRGRTCRACHEVHASGQAHHIRAAVPFGSIGWLLKLNYVKTPDGGSCSKTCHDTRTYRRGAAPGAVADAK